jgi:hypothetical protein
MIILTKLGSETICFCSTNCTQFYGLGYKSYSDNFQCKIIGLTFVCKMSPPTQIVVIIFIFMKIGSFQLFHIVSSKT